jgi:hypothetical protein
MLLEKKSEALDRKGCRGLKGRFLSRSSSCQATKDWRGGGDTTTGSKRNSQTSDMFASNARTEIYILEDMKKRMEYQRQKKRDIRRRRKAQRIKGNQASRDEMRETDFE